LVVMNPPTVKAEEPTPKVLTGEEFDIKIKGPL
jgi:hypothetical protein